MPSQKDFKRVVRARMRKTGESYTSARAHVLRHPRPAASKAVTKASASTPAATPSQYAALAGMSDEKVKKATGCPWERWVKALDHVEAYTWSLREIAKHIREKYKTPSWWTQTVTVGYERIKGLRSRGQQRDGTHRTSKSKVMPVPVSALFEAFQNEVLRSQWLVGLDAVVRGSTRDKSMRLACGDGTAVVIGFTSKGVAKSQVALEHTKLPSKAAADERKAFWTDRLQALAELLAGR